jgi:hypothetical protein
MLMIKQLFFIILAVTVVFIGPAVNQAFLAYHGPDDSLEDHFFTFPTLSDKAGDFAYLVIGIILFMLTTYLGVQFLDDPRRQLFCGWHNSSYLEAGHSNYPGIAAPKHPSSLGLFIFHKEGLT